MYDYEGYEEKFVSYDEALYDFEGEYDDHENLVIKKDDKVIKMKYGIVSFNVDEACTINTEYYSYKKDGNDYLNGCYGIDAAYIDSNKDGVFFLISDDKGFAKYKDVTLIPYEELNIKPSSYHTKDGKLYHDIKTQTTYDYFSSSIFVSEDIDFLEDNEIYYSYDGHYFYDDFKVMSVDYHNGNYDNAINKEPYYNYYQYLPYRSLSNYNYSDVEKYFYDTLGITGKLDSYNDLAQDGANDDINRSQLYGEIDSFFSYQYIYGTNALMLIASSIVDSDYGKNATSYYNNSLYTNMAFDNEYEKETNHYENIEKSIYSYAKYFISGIYSDYHRKTYYGTYFGNKIGGINVEYSLDPYYGEKCASVLNTIDTCLGKSDYNNYALAIINKNLSFYKDKELEKFSFKTKNIKELSLVILDEYEESYKVQIDYSNSQDYSYDFEENVAYISKDDVTLVINNGKIHELEYHKVKYDFDGGVFANEEKLKIKIPEDCTLNIEPNKEGYRFVGFNSDNVAQYKEISDVELSGYLSDTLFLNDYLDLSKAKIRIIYSDGSDDVEPLNTNHISYYDNSYVNDAEIEISYNGISTNKTINIIEDEYYGQIKDAINDLDEKNALFVKRHQNGSSYKLDFSEIIAVDKVLHDTNGYNYHIYDNDRNIGVSGMALSLSYPVISSLIYRDTFYIKTKDSAKNEIEKVQKYADAYNFNIEDAINIDFSMNYTDLSLLGPVIISCDINNADHNVYSVYHPNSDGDIVKCKTLYSDNSVSFVAYEEGDYIIMSLDNINDISLFDGIQNVTKINSDPDNHGIIRTVFYFAIIMLIGFINIFISYIVDNKRKNLWIDYRKSLRLVDYVQEEKQKN
ncbi:MAG: hypothetical protein Q4E33_00435 [Erysipelotrichaceae bacterium]|nr:hypothetical protein [Erysipelotrichaceae bacterium]